MALQISEIYSRSGPLNSLYELTQRVAAAERSDAIFEAALVCLRACLSVEKASISLFDDSGIMRFKAWLDLSTEYRQALEGHSPWRPDARDAQPVLVSDVRQEQDLAPLADVIEAEGVRALAFIPLVLNGKLLGKFMLCYPGLHHFDAEEVLVAQATASQIAVAIDRQSRIEEHEQGAAIFDSVLVGIVEIDLHSHLHKVNGRFCEMVGRSREQLTSGVDVFDITHPEDREKTRQSLSALEEGANHFTIEKRYVRPDGSVVWVSNSVSAIRDEAGSLKGAVAIVADVTERHLAEDELRRSEERYRELIGAVGLAVYTTDATGRITLYNEAAVELWGRRPEIGKDLWCGSWRIYDPDNGHEVPLEECPMAVTLKEDRPVRDIEIVVERPDGSRAVVLPYPTPLHDAAGNLVGAVNVLLDITDRKKGEQAALYLGALVESSEDAIVSKNLNGIITSWNRGAEKIFGYSAAEAVGQSIRLIIPQERHSEEDEVLARLRRGERIENFETVRRRKDGSELHVSLTVSPVKDRRGIIIGASKIARDISGRKAAEEAIQESITIKDQFLSLLSHELRTPLSMIYGNGLLLQRRDEHLASEDRKQAFTDIVSQSSKVQSIIENLLLITRLEAGQLRAEPLSLAPVVREVIADLQRQSPDRKVIFAADADVPVANGQPTLINLVLRNLLENADKYSPTGATIEVKLRNQSGLPEVSVIDHGIGMEKAELDEIFTPFFRTQRARASAKGMGLGLAVCRRIVEAHGGTMKVSSEPNKGSAFAFSLPPAEG